jgi:ABC-type sugar transport system ATPase subunit
MAQRGMGILFMSTEIPEILGIADRVLVMHEGQITAEFTRAEATQERLVAAAAGEPVSTSGATGFQEA